MNSKPCEAKIDPHKYLGRTYLSKERWASYRETINAITALEPERTLEIGPGNGIVSSILGCLGFEVLTIDINAGIKPNIVGSMSELPFSQGAFDLIVATQVLEHLPFDQFAPVISQLHLITRRALIISLPHLGPFLSVGLKIPLLPWKNLNIQLPFPSIIEGSKDHYWEIGSRGSGVNIHTIFRLCTDAGFIIEESFRVSDNPCHHFFVLKKVTGPQEKL